MLHVFPFFFPRQIRQHLIYLRSPASEKVSAFLKQRVQTSSQQQVREEKRGREGWRADKKAIRELNFLLNFSTICINLINSISKIQHKRVAEIYKKKRFPRLIITNKIKKKKGMDWRHQETKYRLISMELFYFWILKQDFLGGRGGVVLF